MSNDERYAVPQAKDKDILYTAGEVLSNLLPFAGPDLFRLVFASPLETRRNKWMEEVSRGLTELHDGHFIDINDLVHNEEFITLATETSKSAIAQHEKEKLQALKNALLNSLVQNLSFDIKFAFIKAVEQLTPRHIQVLKYAKENLTYHVPIGVTYKQIIKELSEKYFDGTEEVAGVFFDDLQQLRFIQKNVVDLGRALGSFTSTPVDQFLFTSWGEKFLNFISNPEMVQATEN